MSLAKKIEDYLKRLLEQQDAVELQRSELAESFKCVPSQINYVLSTRFTPAQGYLVESRRGGGGYLRIIKLSWEAFPHYMLKDVFEDLGVGGLDQWEAEGILKRFYEENLITRREYNVLKAVISRETLALELPEQDFIRAKIMQAVLAALCRNDHQ